MEEKEKKFLKDFNVYINCNFKESVDTEKEAWDVIGRQRFGCGHMVYDIYGHIREEFVPY